MNLGKTLLATAVGGVVYFLLGWLVFGMLLMGQLEPAADVKALIVRPDAEFGMVPMLLSCFLWAGMLAYIFSKWAGIKSFASGATAGAIIAGLASFSFDFGMVAMYKSNFIDVPKAIINSGASVIVNAILGGIIGWMLGRGTNE